MKKSIVKRLMKRCTAMMLAALLIGGTVSGVVAEAAGVVVDPKVDTYDTYRYRIGVPKTLPEKKKAKTDAAASIHFSIGIPRDIIVSAYIKGRNGKRVSKKTVRFTNTTKDTKKKIAYETGKGNKGTYYSPCILVENGSKCTYLDFAVYFTP